MASLLQLCCLRHTFLPQAGSVPCLRLSLEDGLWHWPAPTCRGIQHNISFIFTVSCNDFSGPPCRESPAKNLASVALLHHRGRFYNPAKFYCPLGWSLPPTHPHICSSCCVFLGAESGLGLFFPQVGSIAGWGLTLSTPCFILNQAYL